MTMGATRNVAVLVGSLRKDSLNRKTALAMRGLAPAELALSIVEIGSLPLYNPDHEADPPPVVREFKDASEVDAVLFVTPEYNRSVPGVLKTLSMSDRARTARAHGRESRGPRQRFSRPHQRLRRQSPSTPVARIPERRRCSSPKPTSATPPVCSVPMACSPTIRRASS
jgi:hypothetical protein